MRNVELLELAGGVCAASALFEGPRHEGKNFIAAAEIEFIDGLPVVAGFANETSPVTRVIEVEIGHSIWHFRRLAKGGGAVEVPGARAGMSGSAKGLASVSGIVDAQQLIVVALIGMLVRAWVVRVVHARAKIRIIEVGVLMVQSESVADFLAGDEIAPNGGESGIRM